MTPGAKYLETVKIFRRGVESEKPCYEIIQYAAQKDFGDSWEKDKQENADNKKRLAIE